MHILDADRKSFVFSPGPLFANVVLADEINRSNPRAQSALLEAMSERQVTVDNRTYKLPTVPRHRYAEPVRAHGTYPLPESQLDRFNLRLSPLLPGPRFRAAAHPREQSPDDAGRDPGHAAAGAGAGASGEVRPGDRP